MFTFKLIFNAQTINYNVGNIGDSKMIGNLKCFLPFRCNRISRISD